MSDPVVIVSFARTPIGAFQGELSGLSAAELGSAAIAAAVERAGVKPGEIDDVIMGCVLPAGQGQAPARQAARGAGLPDHVGATTISKMCGSGMKAAMLAHDNILAGSADIMVAGGMESMSNAPYLMDKARTGLRMGHGKVYDHMFLDGLEDAYQKGTLMGVFADDTARKYDLSRTAQDEFAIESLKRAGNATVQKYFAEEIAPVTIKGKAGDTVISEDEGPKRAKPDKILQLKPAFGADGTVTAATSSSISDGAAAMVLMKKSEAEKRGLKIEAIIRSHATHAQAPAEFTVAPIGAIEKALQKAGWTKDAVDLYEINEAFAVVTMATVKQLGLDMAKVNIHGGACALGHPIGATGARIMATLIAALKRNNLKKGIAALCIGGGEATAIALEIV